ncbi:hypothetical protein [Kitasatospora sp. GP82]|uniref:hypothetical protein n=1 Tax=Kitasatospora sp. GP82 TaxID=3035089 RepID=UPI0024768332|nr:hypothetical protein [Kitasatospora sp. GP82]MDH6125670.1 putative anti-sigma-YlaC factor YlaD [Kitasatospora sp. GP82]
MTCADYRAAMSAHLDGENADTAAAVGGPEALAAHGEQCADCRDWLAAARGLQTLAATAQGPSEEWADGLLARLLSSEEAGRDRAG